MCSLEGSRITLPFSRSGLYFWMIFFISAGHRTKFSSSSFSFSWCIKCTKQLCSYENLSPYKEIWSIYSKTCFFEAWGGCRLIWERASLRLNHKWSAQYVEKQPKECFTANLFFTQPNSYLTYMSICIYGFVCFTPAAAAIFFCLKKMLKNQSCFMQK